MKQILLIAIFVLCSVAAVWAWIAKPGDEEGTVKPDKDGALRVKVEISGGHETYPVDHGRPVVLVAGALAVKPEVFREAFSKVQPAPAGREPEPEQVRKNKEALMTALGPHGVTNERLDEVSNYYRYQPGRGKLWPTEEATVYAWVKDGRVTRFEIAAGGSGYSSPPTITVPGVTRIATDVRLAFDKDFAKNGSISAVNVKPNRD